MSCPHSAQCEAQRGNMKRLIFALSAIPNVALAQGPFGLQGGTPFGLGGPSPSETTIEFLVAIFVGLLGVAFLTYAGGRAKFFRERNEPSTHNELGSQRSPAGGSPARNYDAAKWDALVKYDDDVASAEKTIRPLGQKWVDELARSYLALGDKSYLPKIVETIEERAATAVRPPPPRSASPEAEQPLDPPRQAEPPQRDGDTMSKGVGIAALVLAILAIFIPLYGLFISVIASVCAVISALAGDRIFAIAAPVITAANLLFLSPSFWYIQNNSSDKTVNYVVLGVLVGAPFVAMYLCQNGKLRIGSKN
jgi:hypothetical protein